jgi:hypothetical protein
VISGLLEHLGRGDGPSAVETSLRKGGWWLLHVRAATGESTRSPGLSLVPAPEQDDDLEVMLDPQLDLPDLVGVAGVVTTAASAEMVLTAGYFDTQSLALGSAGATLRRRTGGTDDGWHQARWRTASAGGAPRSVAAPPPLRSRRWSRP